MTVASKFYDWQNSTLNWDAPPYEQCSPNLLAILKFLRDVWGGYSLGCEGDRPVRTGTKPSSHSYGAAVDWRWEWASGVPAGIGFITRATLDEYVLPFLIGQSAELGIQALHDEGRIWRPPGTSGRPIGSDGWKPYDTGYDGWLHIETHLDSWGWTTPVTDRFVKEEAMNPPYVLVPTGPWAQWWYPHIYVGTPDRKPTTTATGEIDDNVPRHPVTDEGQYRRRCHQAGIQLVDEKPG